VKLRFGLRTVFVLIAVISIPLGWCAYQLNWIRQRHEFLHRPGIIPYLSDVPLATWSLRLFGEEGAEFWKIPNPNRDDPETILRESRRLFPEAKIVGVPPVYSGNESPWPDFTYELSNGK
jgi:hypothetical protein